MKRCPECDSSFPETDKFCELDGTTLVADYSDTNADGSVPPAGWNFRTGGPADMASGGYRVPRDRQNWTTLTIVAVAGVAISAVLFLIYQRTRDQAPEQSPGESSNVAVTQRMPLIPFRPSPTVSASPSPEPSPSPNATLSPKVEATPERVGLSSSSVSTSGDEKTRRGQVIIRLTNGTTVEADEAWETREGIWYRRRGVVALLERDQVKAIEKPSPASSASATPSISPSASP